MKEKSQECLTACAQKIRVAVTVAGFLVHDANSKDNVELLLGTYSK